MKRLKSDCVGCGGTGVITSPMGDEQCGCILYCPDCAERHLEGEPCGCERDADAPEGWADG